MLSRVKILFTYFIKGLSGTLQRILVLLSLILIVLGGFVFLYGLYTHDSFYCATGAIASLVYLYVNKQT